MSKYIVLEERIDYEDGTETYRDGLIRHIGSLSPNNKFSLVYDFAEASNLTGVTAETLWKIFHDFSHKRITVETKNKICSAYLDYHHKEQGETKESGEICIACSAIVVGKYCSINCTLSGKEREIKYKRKDPKVKKPVNIKAMAKIAREYLEKFQEACALLETHERVRVTVYSNEEVSSLHVKVIETIKVEH